MNASIFYTKDELAEIQASINQSLNAECDDYKFIIDIKAQSSELNVKLRRAIKDAMIFKSKIFIKLVEENCNKSIDDINNYFSKNKERQFEKTKDIEVFKDQIKMRVIAKSFLFISNDDIVYDEFKFGLLGLLFEADYFLNNEQKDYIKKRFKYKEYQKTIMNKKISRVKYAIDSIFDNEDIITENRDHILLKREIDTQKQIFLNESISLKKDDIGLCVKEYYELAKHTHNIPIETQQIINQFFYVKQIDYWTAMETENWLRNPFYSLENPPVIEIWNERDRSTGKFTGIFMEKYGAILTENFLNDAKIFIQKNKSKCEALEFFKNIQI